MKGTAKMAVLILILMLPMMHAEVEQILSAANQNETDSPLHISVVIPKNYEQVEAGNELLVSVRLINVRGHEKVDVLMEYDIEDKSGKRIITQTETIAIETQANLVRIFNIPGAAPHGRYIIRTIITYEDGRTAAAQSSFEVLRQSGERWKDYLPLTLIAAACIMMIFYLSTRYHSFIGGLQLKLKIRRIVHEKLRY